MAERGAARVDDVVDRLGRRGVLTIKVEDGTFDVRLATRGPYGHLAWCSTDKADLFEHCHLGATNWHGEGADLAELLVTCEEESRPRREDVAGLIWSIEHRRDTRTLGPPLPSYDRWRGWRPGQDRWLRTSSHAREYLDGYRRDLNVELERTAEEQDSQRRLERRRREHVRRVLEGA